jgi:uncharacterized protein (UPF0548 family)
MFLLKRPTDEQIHTFLESQHDLPFSYREQGATRNLPPPRGYRIDHNRLRLGEGAAIFEQGVQALKCWQHFDLGWVKSFPANAPVAIGSTVAVRVRHFALWSLNGCRIVYLIDEMDGPVRRFGFAYGTLPDHAERGEERFTIEWETANDSVWYDILAFSRPQHWAAKLGYPLTRWWQKRFAQQSLRAMAGAVEPGFIKSRTPIR